jgi:hypothetical protein
MTAFVQAHDHPTSAAVRAKARSALKRALAGEEAAQGSTGWGMMMRGRSCAS